MISKKPKFQRMILYLFCDPLVIIMKLQIQIQLITSNDKLGIGSKELTLDC